LLVAAELLSVCISVGATSAWTLSAAARIARRELDGLVRNMLGFGGVGILVVFEFKDLSDVAHFIHV
jgi:hypothetical protein